MPLKYKARRRLSLIVLLIGLPIYIVSAVTIVNMMDRPPIAMELLVYVVLGFFWILPLKSIFLGVGREDPDANKDEGED